MVLTSFRKCGCIHFLYTLQEASTLKENRKQDPRKIKEVGRKKYRGKFPEKLAFCVHV